MTSAPTDVPARPWRSRFAWLHPKAYLGLHGLAGVVATTICLWLFAWIADEIPEQSTLVRIDDTLGQWIQARVTEWGESVFVFIAWLGAPVLTAVVAVMLIVLLRRRDWLRAGALAVTTVGGVLLSNVLKLVFHRGRPESAVEFITRPSWSFPSGHAMNSLITYGFLALLLLEHVQDRGRRAAIVLGTAILVLVIGISRLYLGVHYLSDVIGGYLAGAVWLTVCVVGYEFAKRRLHPGAPPATGAAESTAPAPTSAR